MYKSFIVRNFRCFHDFTVQPLSRVNLVAGKNNVGKTALLEVLWIHQGLPNLTLPFSVNVLRGITVFTEDVPLGDLFSEFDFSTTIETLSQDWENRSKSLHIQLSEKRPSRVPLIRKDAEEQLRIATTEITEYEIVFEYTDESGHSYETHALLLPDGTIQFDKPLISKPATAIFLAARRPPILLQDVQRFGKLEVSGEHEDIVTILQLIEPRLRRLAVVVHGQVSIIHGDIGMGRLIPVPIMGDGMSRLLSLTLAIATAKNGIVLIDEIENGLHYTIRLEVWKAITALARKFNVQIFATTHSEECIRAAHQAFQEDIEYDFALHRLERVGDSVHSVTYDQETLATALITGLEVR